MRGIVAKIQVKESREAEFEALVAELVAESRREAGCLSYELWRSDGAREYVFIERYADDAAAQAHVKSDHYRRIGRQLGALMDGAANVFRLTAPEPGAGATLDGQGLVANGCHDPVRARLHAPSISPRGTDVRQVGPVADGRRPASFAEEP